MTRVVCRTVDETIAERSTQKLRRFRAAGLHELSALRAGDRSTAAGCGRPAATVPQHGAKQQMRAPGVLRT